MMLSWVLILCLACGAIFAYLATWMTTTKGNTISDILNSQKFSDANAIKMEILDKVKISSNIPIVALFIVAFAVAIALPAFIVWNLFKDTDIITISGEFKDFIPDKKIYIVPKEMHIESSGAFQIPIMYSRGNRIITFESDHYRPVSLNMTVNELKSSIIIKITNSDPEENPIELPLDLHTWTANLSKPIPLILATSTRELDVANIASEVRPISPNLKDIGDPPGVKK